MADLHISEEELMAMYRTDRSVYTPADFLQWRENGSLNLTPKFQRRGVWTTPARSYFIDTLLRGMPIPAIYLRMVQGPQRNRFVREVVDGQQRISAVLSFIDGDYRISRTLQASWGGKLFNQLTDSEQRRISSYSFSAEVFQGISDEAVLAVFSRLNTYSVPLNAQELRNGKFFGLFKQAAYQLALQHLEFWRKHRIFTEQSIARMLEVELASELLIAGKAGMQDKKRTIDTFYSDQDEAYPEKKRDEERFCATIDTITETIDAELKETAFRRPPLFYTLYCATYHRLFGLPGEPHKTPKRPLSKEDRQSLRDAVIQLSEYIAANRDDQPAPAKYEQFIAACSVQTDNIKPRKTRFDFLYKRAF